MEEVSLENKQLVKVGGKTYRQEVDATGRTTLIEVATDSPPK